MLKNKTVLILGGSSSIGSNFIYKNHKKFKNIISTYRSSDRAIIKNKNVIKYQINLEKYSEINKFKKYLLSSNQLPDIIINLAAPKLKFSRFEDLKYKDYKLNFDIQFRPFFEILNLTIKNMQKNNYGKVICVLSSSIDDLPSYMNQYISTKYALLGFMSSLSNEYKKFDIQFISISPSMIASDFISNIPKQFIEISNMKKKLLRPSKVSDFISKLISSKNKNKNKLNNYI